MLENYFKISWRNILKYKGFSFINIFGLALAMSVCMLIILMIADQKSYDQFHEKKDRTYRVLSKRKESTKPNASSPFPLATALESDYPIVEKATTLTLGVGGDAFYNKRTAQMRGFFADPDFFDVFDYTLDTGNPDEALVQSNSAVISAEFAGRLFNDENPVGKTIDFTDRGLGIIDKIGKESPPVNWGIFTVTGVISNKKYKSHLKFDALISASSMKALQNENKIKDITNDWATYSRAFTYVVLVPGKSVKDLNTALNDVVARKYRDIEHLQGFTLVAQNLMHITPGIFVGNPTSLSLPIDIYYYLLLLGLVIILSACLNYINLSTARSIIRSKEIGVRKVIGANKRSLIFQFLCESVFTALLSMIVACALVFFFLKSAFLNLWVNHYLNFDLRPNFQVFIIFLGFTLLVGLIAGSYPALYLSRHRPISAIKSVSAKSHGKFGFGVMKVLSTSQFIISLFFITTSILVFKQFKHFIAFKYEFNSNEIVNIPLQGNSYQLLRNELGTVPGVYEVSACSFIPATGMAHGASVRKLGDDGDYIQSEILHVDEYFFSNLQLSLVAGKNLSANHGGAHEYTVVNEAMVKALGYENAADVIGQVLEFGAGVEVVGVIEDFRFQTPMTKDEIGPLLLMNKPEKFNFINVKIASADMTGTVERLSHKWKAIDPVHPFKYQFFDDELKNANRALGDVVAIIGYISFLAITIACLGVFGLATYATQKREKEVGIRKVLGATEFKIAFLLSKEFLIILTLAIVIAGPLSYLLNHAWLQNFPNRVEFGFTTVVLASVILIALALIAIGSQTIRASRQNPAEVLKGE